MRTAVSPSRCRAIIFCFVLSGRNAGRYFWCSGLGMSGLANHERAWYEQACQLMSRAVLSAAFPGTWRARDRSRVEE